LANYGYVCRRKQQSVKIELILVQYLYNNKELTLQGIGTFRLDESVSLPADTDKEVSIPANAITFTYNPKVTEDDNLINFIVTHTKKIKPLASADLDSFLMLGRQFMNIGKPFTLDGIGTLHRSHQGGFDFIPGQFINAKIEAPKNLNEGESDDPNVNFHEYGSQQRGNNKKPVLIILFLLLLAGAGWAAWYYYFRDRNETNGDVQTQQTVTPTDTSAVRNDTAATPATSAPVNDPLAGRDHTFRIVIKESNDRAAVEASLKKLNSWGHPVIMYTTDSVNYKLVELFTRPLTDTGAVRDSLKRFFGGSTRVEVK
jgi:hypothetical protein